MSKSPLIALPILLLCACSPKPSPAPTPPVPGNLAAKCPALPKPPVVLVDPARAEWELALIALYGECAAKMAVQR